MSALPTPRTGPAAASNTPDPRDYADLEGPLIELAQRSGGDLRKLLTAFFGFLHRRTDFYCVPSAAAATTTTLDGQELVPASSIIGFKEGDAEKLLLAAFRQFPLRRVPPPSQQKKQQPLEQGCQAAKKHPAAAAVSAAAATTTSAPTETGIKKAVTANKKKQDDAQQQQTDSCVMMLTEEGLQIPVGNGGSTDRYKWTQTLEECTVLVGIPPGVRGKDLQVLLQPMSLSIRRKNTLSPPADAADAVATTADATTAAPRTHSFLEGELTHRIVPSESTWTLESGVLQVVLYKQLKTFWETVLTGDAKIDADLVDSRRNISTYDEATQAQIRKIMFDQQQQQKGLPTSDELTTKQHNKVSTIPPLPPGVEYIDQEILDAKMKELGK